MNNRVFLMILACLAFYLLWLNLGKQFGYIPEPEDRPAPQAEEMVEMPPQQVEQQEVKTPEAEQEPASEEEQALAAEKIELPPLENEYIAVQCDQEGGVIRSVLLKKFVGSKKDQDPIVLVMPTHHAPGEILFTGGLTSADWTFHVEQPGDRTLVFRQTRNGLSIRKEISLGQTYDVKIDVEVKRDGRDVDYRFVIAEGLQPLGQKDVKSKSFFSAAAINPKLLQVAWSKSGDEDTLPAAKVESIDFIDHAQDATLDWIGITDTYFANVFIPQSQFLGFLTKKVSVAMSGETTKATDVPIVALRADRPLSGTFFMGPKTESVILPVDSRLENLVSYGWAGLLSKWMYKLLKGFYAFLGNWGWSIIGLTILIRLVLVPISMPSIKSSFKMRKIQPKIDALRKKYPGKDMESRQKLSQETFKLYKEEGVNPFSSCITILPQLPIFIAYFSLLRTSISLRQSEWMFWVNDLSAKDPTFILPIIMGVTMYLSQLTMPMPGDPAQQKMMKLMPLFLTLMFLTMPSGLMLYMITSNLFQLGQSYFMKWRYRDL